MLMPWEENIDYHNTATSYVKGAEMINQEEINILMELKDGDPIDKTDAVVKGREYNEGYKDGQDATERNMGKALNRWYDQGFKDGQASLSKAYADGKGDEIERQQGRDEAWEAANRIMKIPIHERAKLFGVSHNKACFADISDRFTASEAIEKLKAYEEEQAQIKVGDVVRGKSGEIGVVTRVYASKLDILWIDGSTGRWPQYEMTKTGKRIDAIYEVLEQMKEEPEVEHTMTGDEIARLFEEE